MTTECEVVEFHRKRSACPEPGEGQKSFARKRRDSSVAFAPSEWQKSHPEPKGKDPFARKDEILRRPDRVGTPQDDSVVTMSSWAKRRISFRERRDSLSRLHQDSEWQNGALKWKYGKAFISRIWNCRLSWKGLL